MAPRLAPTPSDTRVDSIDGLRGMALLMVVCGHFVGSLGLLGKFWIYDRLFGSPFHLFFNEMDAVIVFFVLSGFVMHLPFTSAKREVKFGAFWGRRLFRLYPLYLLHFILILGLYYFVLKPGAVAAFNPGLSIFTTAPTWTELWHELIPIRPDLLICPLNGPLWSILVEFKISLVFPIVMLLAKKLNKAEFALILAITWGLCALTQSETWQYLPMFMLGAFGAQHRDWLASFAPKKAPMQILALLVLLSALSARFFIGGHQYFYHSLSAVVALLLIVVVTTKGPVQKLYAQPVLVGFGRMTYPFYLFHLMTYLALLSQAYAYFGPKHWPAFAVAAPATLIISGALAWLAHKYIEMPMNAVGHRLFSGKKRPA
jgi:peptidoglycan/LPS O-acetylase OafA/YrhL